MDIMEILFLELILKDQPESWRKLHVCLMFPFLVNMHMELE